MKILTLLPGLLLLLMLLPCLSEGKVVKSFTDCPQFFLPNDKNHNAPTIPTILHGSDNTERYKKICQVYEDKARFATLYDTTHRIPVYSAYTFDSITSCERDCKWKIEPQLEDPKKGVNMQKNMEPDPTGDLQALDEDYKSQKPYTRGHLYPYCYGREEKDKHATCTLTNAAPQSEKHNNIWATKVEQPLREKINTNCKKAYIVTGVVPGLGSNDWLKRVIDSHEVRSRRVNVPSHFWTAYCCQVKDGVKVDGAVDGRVSGAYLSENVKEPTDANFKIEIKVRDLETALISQYGMGQKYLDYGRALFEASQKPPDATLITKAKNAFADILEFITFHVFRYPKDDVPFTLFGGIKGCT